MTRKSLKIVKNNSPFVKKIDEYGNGIKFSTSSEKCGKIRGHERWRHYATFEGAPAPLFETW